MVICSYVLQTTNTLIVGPQIVLEVLTVYGNELRLFLAKEFPILLTIYAAHMHIAAVGTIINVFSYDMVSGQDKNLSPYRQRADAIVLCQKLKTRQLAEFFQMFYTDIIVRKKTNYVSLRILCLSINTKKNLQSYISSKFVLSIAFKSQ